jgi:hypothetical protein
MQQELYSSVEQYEQRVIAMIKQRMFRTQKEDALVELEGVLFELQYGMKGETA